MPPPTIFSRYLHSYGALMDVPLSGGGARVIEHNGRQGLVMSNRPSKIALDRHNVNAPTGSLSFWLLSFEDLSSSRYPQWTDEADPSHWAYTLLSDLPDLRNRWDANFALIWDHNWYPQFYAKFYRGEIYPKPRQGKIAAFGPGQAGYEYYRALAAAGHWSIRKMEWYQVGVTWNKPDNDYRVYLNGILVATVKRGITIQYDNCGETLYMGNTCLAFSDLSFYTGELDGESMERLYSEQGGEPRSDLNRDLRHVYSGLGNPPLEALGAGWEERVSLPLNRLDDLARFYIQGCLGAPQIGGEGMRVQTPLRRPRGPGEIWYEEDARIPIPPERLAPPGTWYAGEARDLEQVYLWLKEPIMEGDLRIEYDFKPQTDNGLSLLMVQCTGMQREDFMADDPVRTNGSMRTVFGENVRNYHWEYYRRVGDTRTDLASHVLVKNPCLHPLAMGHQQILEVGRWHRLVFLQQGARLTGAINGEVVIDCTDSAFDNNGPVYNTGRIAIRCMIQSDIIFRNLRVWNRPAPYREVSRRLT